MAEANWLMLYRMKPYWSEAGGGRRGVDENILNYESKKSYFKFEKA